MGAKRDFVVINYQGEDRLLIPVENIDTIDRYVADGESYAIVDKLGRGSFAKLKEKVKDRLFEIANDIIRLAAARELVNGIKIDIDDYLIKDFQSSAGFKYTKDQTRSINEILADLSSGKVMDRLLSGDVGFGKTEELIYEESFDLLLFDVNIPNITGFELLKNIRQNNINIPTIFITSRHTADDVKIGFNSGCDDYIKKPFELSELQLRIENIKRLRQIDNHGQIKIDNDTFYNYEKKVITRNHEEFNLSKIEAKILEYFLKNKNKTMSEIFSIMGIGAVSLTLFLTQVAKKYIEIRYIPLVALS